MEKFQYYDKEIYNYNHNNHHSNNHNHIYNHTHTHEYNYNYDYYTNNNNNYINHYNSTNGNNNKNEEEELKKVTEKLKEEREKNNLLKETNEKLFQDIITLKTNIKNLIPILPQHKIYPFPTFEALIKEIKTYFNIDSLKFYQKLHYKNQFPFDIIILHFKYIFQLCHGLIQNHFSLADYLLEKKFKTNELLKPIKSTLLNTYQIEWKIIYNNLTTEEKINNLIIEIKQAIYTSTQKEKCGNNLNGSTYYINYLKDYIKLTIEILLKCYISEPKICYEEGIIGHIEKYNTLNEESLIEDNIIRGKDVVILLPSFYYNCNRCKKNDFITKEKVIIYKNENYISKGNNRMSANNSGNHYYEKKNENAEKENNIFYSKNNYNELYFKYQSNNNSIKYYYPPLVDNEDEKYIYENSGQRDSYKINRENKIKK